MLLSHQVSVELDFLCWEHTQHLSLLLFLGGGLLMEF